MAFEAEWGAGRAGAPPRVRRHGVPVPERRRSPRSRRRIPCVLEAIGSHAALTVDLALDGLLVRTRARLAAGTPVRVRLQIGIAEIPLTGRVVRLRQPPRGLDRWVAGGVAIALDAPPPAYRALLAAP